MKQLENQVFMYLEQCQFQKELDSKTIRAYRFDLMQFIGFLENNKYSIDKEGISAYLFFLHKTYKQKTTKRKIASIKAFFHYLEYEEMLERNPFNRIRTKFKEERILPKSIPYEVIEQLFSYIYNIRENIPKNREQEKLIVRDLAILELMFMTGVRISELCNLKVEAIDLEQGLVRVYGKGGKERVIPIGNRDVVLLLKEYKKLFTEKIDAYFFVNRWGNPLSDQAVRLMINKYTKEAGIKMHLTPHMFRHSFATLLLEEDVDIRIIQALLGHSSIVTTQIYAHVASEKKRNVLEHRHPRNQMLLRKRN